MTTMISRTVFTARFAMATFVGVVNFFTTKPPEKPSHAPLLHAGACVLVRSKLLCDVTTAYRPCAWLMGHLGQTRDNEGTDCNRFPLAFQDLYGVHDRRT